ncbi:MAG TPA: hypothetical protein VMV69_20125 [Pirellulales bacterium]|nr:hypothetical protein [Pirellulales bacterium]
MTRGIAPGQNCYESIDDHREVGAAACGAAAAPCCRETLVLSGTGCADGAAARHASGTRPFEPATSRSAEPGPVQSMAPCWPGSLMLGWPLLGPVC